LFNEKRIFLLKIIACFSMFLLKNSNYYHFSLYIMEKLVIIKSVKHNMKGKIK